MERVAEADTNRATGAARRSRESLVAPVLLAAAALGWWVSVAAQRSMGAGETVPLAAFIVAWAAMMTAMMFPAIVPVVKLYARAAGARRVAPLPFFVSGYLAVWTSVALPAYLAWRVMMGPLSDRAPWAGRLAGAVLVAGAVWQASPWKSICLRHCRSPMSVFLRSGRDAARRASALRMGATHGVYCVGCCWALMAVLVAAGAMSLVWVAALAVLIFVEKNTRHGEGVAAAAAAAFAVAGAALLLDPSWVTAIN